MSDKLISVIVPVYNVKQYIEKCVQSIISQTFIGLELILIDDGSTDGSGELCDELQKLDTRIKVIHQRNSGSTAARNAGLKAAVGQYIGFVDADDWIEPNMYESLWKYASETDADIVICGRYEDIGKASQKRNPKISEGYYGKDTLENYVYRHMIIDGRLDEWGIFPVLWDKLWRRDIVERGQFSLDERITMGEDAACVYPCILQAGSIYVTHECLYHYRQTTGSMIKRASNREMWREKYRILHEYVWSKLKSYPASYNLKEQWFKYMLTLMVPRAGIFYNGMDNLDYLFPFSEIKRGSKIVIYGAGTFGQHLYGYLHDNGFCEVVLWADRKEREYRKMGLNVSAPEAIRNSTFDYIAVAIMGYGAMTAVRNELAAEYGEQRVAVLDEQLIMSDETYRAFGLE